MVFNTYSNNISFVYNAIVDSLVEADPTKFEKMDIGTNTDRAAFKYIPENRYIMFVHFTHGTCLGATLKIGSGWDATNKTPNGTVETYGANLFYSGGDLNARIFSHMVYVDKFGFFWNIYNPYSDANSNGALIKVEFIPLTAKEYNDGASSIFVHCDTYPTQRSYETEYIPYYAYGQYLIRKGDSNFIAYTATLKAFKSTGNNKIYFEFPRLHNNPTTYTSPIYQTKRWFYVNKVGLAVNDVISWLDPDNVTIHKFIITEIGSARGKSDIYYAIPYENAYMYE